MKEIINKFCYLQAEADLGFSRKGGGVDFQKFSKNFVNLLFFVRSAQIIFRVLSKH